MKINKQKISKIGLIIVFTILFLYFVFDMTIKLRDNLFLKGYTYAIYELINIGEKCEPFDITLGDQQIFLINIECLETEEEIKE